MVYEYKGRRWEAIALLLLGAGAGCNHLRGKADLPQDAAPDGARDDVPDGGPDSVQTHDASPDSAIPPVVNGGPDVTLTSPDNATLLRGAVAAAPGGPTLGAVTARWTVVSGPGVVEFSDPGALVSQVVFRGTGTFVLRLTAGDGAATGSDDVIVTVLPCVNATQPLDVMLVLDRSLSMDDDGKFQGAQDGAKQFIDDLDLTRDQIGLVAFWRFGDLLSTLSRDGAGVKAKIDGLGTLSGSDINAGLELAFAELKSPRHNPAALPVIVLLTDGQNTAPIIAGIKAAKIRIITVGMGADADRAFLGQAATAVSDYYFAPSGSDVAWICNHITQNICRNAAPLVRAGPDQMALAVHLPHILTLNGEVHDDGPPNGGHLEIAWTQVSGPSPAIFVSQESAVTDVVFMEPGSYVLRLTASDALSTSNSDVTVVVDQAPALTGGQLVVSAASAGPLNTGETETVTVSLRDVNAVAVEGFPVRLEITGVNPQAITRSTDAHGLAHFSYVGANPGTDTIKATAEGSVTTLTDTLAPLVWTLPSMSGPRQITQGWIGTPRHQAVVTGVVPITLTDGITLTSGTIDFWPITQPGNVTVLTTSATGGPGSTAGSLDTTLLANGTYVIRLTGVNDVGEALGSLVGVTVVGQYKPGRVVVSATEFTVPVAGMPITIGRTYDSLERDHSGDFGNGWALSIAQPRLETDPAHNVTLTMPDGQRVTFFFTPTSFGPPYRFLFRPVYTPEAGVFGTLTADGCELIVRSGDQLPCFLDANEYAPTTYVYTDAYGRVMTMTATGELKSIADIAGNTLAFTADGITGGVRGDVKVAFERDAQGRISKITDLLKAVYQYQYDAAGNLVAVILPSGAELAYTYDAHHFLLKALDANGHSALTSTYFAGGRLESTSDAVGNVTRYSYDTAARTTAITYPDSGTVIQRFDAHGLLLGVTDALGRTSSFTYDARRLKVSETNAAGETTAYTHDDRGLQTSRTGAAGRTWRLAHDHNGQVVTATDAAGNVVNIAYDANGAPNAFVDGMGTLAKFTSTRGGLPMEITDPGGATLVLGHNAQGNLIARIDRLGRATAYTYDGMGRQVTSADPLKHGTYRDHDALGRVVQEIDPVGARTTFEYDAAGNLISQTAPGSTTAKMLYAYDAANRLTGITQFDGTKKSFTYNFRGNKLVETDELGRVTRHEYDKAGQLVKTAYPDGSATQVAYDLLGRTASTTDERGGVTRFEYEANCGCTDRITKITDPLGRATTHKYDASGRRISTVDPAGRETHFNYDLRGRLTETRYPDGSKTTQEYDAVGRVIGSADQAGAVTRYDYDAEGQLLSVTDALGNVTRHEYDAAGNRITTTDANGHVTTQTYDAANRPLRRTPPSGKEENTGYDASGNVVSRTDAVSTTLYAYDVMDRQTARSGYDTPARFTYTATGQRASMVDDSGVTTFTYDARDRLVTKATPQGTLTYTYDATGNVASVRSSNASGVNISYTWDAANQLVSVLDNRAAPATTIANFTPTGRPASRTHPTGVELVYSYDQMDRVVSLLARKGAAAAPPLASYTYTLGPTGNRLAVDHASGRNVAYGYDAAYRLTSETITGDPTAAHNGSVGYAMDPVGNRLRRTSTLAAIPAADYSYDVSDRLSSDLYDDAGNTTGRDGATYQYDAEHRIRVKNGSQPGEVRITYDANGDRVAKTAGGIATRYLLTAELMSYAAAELRSYENEGAAEVTSQKLLGAVVRTRLGTRKRWIGRRGRIDVVVGALVQWREIRGDFAAALTS